MPLFTVWAGGRTHADLPLLMLRAEGFSRQIQTANGRPDFAFAKTFQRAYRTNKVVRTPGAELTGCGCWLSSSSNPLAASAIFSVCGRSVRLVTSSTSRETSSRQKTRHIQLGNHWRGDNDFAFAATKIVRCPCLRHNPQFAVKVANRQRYDPFALLIERDRLRLLRDDIDMVYRRFSAALKVVAIAAKTQRRQPPLPFNDRP